MQTKCLPKADPAAVKLADDITSNSLFGNKSYIEMLTSNINAFSNLPKNLAAKDNLDIVRQVQMIIERLCFFLRNALKIRRIDSCLPRIHLSQTDDQSALLEWNFVDFENRICGRAFR